MHPSDSLDREHLKVLLDLIQDGVASRRQLVELGALDHDVKRMLRRKELFRVAHHRGVYVNHNGPLSWDQRAWAAVLAHWPAVLARESALPNPPRGGPIHVAISLDRRVVAVPRVLVHRTPDLDVRADWGKAPPRIRLEHAAIDVASQGRHDVAAVFRTLTDVCHTRETDAATIGRVLGTRRVAGWVLIAEMLDDIATGACSVLERGYLHRVERAHGLPTGRRQKPARAGGRAVARDVQYEGFDLLVELDGRAFHDNARARDKDALRDLDARVDDELTTVRLTYGLVFDHPCRTARSIEALLKRGGWDGELTPCPHCLDW